MKPRFFIASLAITCVSSPALAHAFLQHASPGAGATLLAPPTSIALTFTEALKPVASGVAVIDASGHDVERGAVVIGGKSMSVPLRPLPPGRYRVAWHALSLDAHRTEGAYGFTVK